MNDRWSALYDLDAWTEAGIAVQDEIASALAEHLGDGFDYLGLKTWRQAPFGVAVYTHAPSGLRFSLVPGGTFQMGLSAREERKLREAAQADASGEGWQEEYGQLLDHVEAMRPPRPTSVKPMLVAQTPIEEVDAEHWDVVVAAFLMGRAELPEPERAQGLDAALQSMGFRLPSEAEWEYAARGGRGEELASLTDAIPDEDHVTWLLSREDPDAVRNAFGLYGFGLYPELCLDHWKPGLEHVPADGSPWRGPSRARVARGGAALVYPWNERGEWHLLLNAFRQQDTEWRWALALRLVRELPYDFH